MANIDTVVLQDEIRSVIADIAEIDPEKITEKAKFIEDLGMDSMMALEILASLEKKYKIKIAEDNLMKMNNLKQTVELVNQCLRL